MPEITAIMMAAMQNDVARLERVATNLANATTPGYKREMWVQRVGALAPSVASEHLPSAVSASTDGAAAAAQPAELARDMRTGTFMSTGQSLDLALTGRGHFELMTDQGPAYSRHGQFHLDSRGRLVNLQGHAVMGQGGEIVLTTDQVRIDSSGKVFDAGREVARLKLVEWERNSAMTPLGGSAFSVSGVTRQVDDGAVSVRQGFLENANVNTAAEMVELTQTMRHFESVMRFAQGRDEMLGTAIRKLGDM